MGGATLILWRGQRSEIHREPLVRVSMLDLIQIRR